MLIVMVMFVVLSIYFFIKAEGLQKKLLKIKKESKTTEQENKSLVDSMALIISCNEGFAKHRIKRAKDKNLPEISIIAPLINNYGVILKEALQGKGRVKAITKKCYDNCTPAAFVAFTAYISKQDAHVKRMWSSSNVSGYISLVEALLINQESKFSNDKSEEK